MFFKKKEKEAKPVQEEIQVSVEEVQQKIAELESTLKDHASSENYAALAQQYCLIKETSKAIECYETILAQDKTLGKNYNELMKLYNVKRREAAEAKDEEQIQFYLNKIDGLMQLSKDVIRGKV